MAELGHPYLWVQSLGGLQFPSDAPEVCVGGPAIVYSKMSPVLSVCVSNPAMYVCVCFSGFACRQFS